MRNKTHLLRWVIGADFCNEFSLVSLGEHPFVLEEEEESKILT